MKHPLVKKTPTQKPLAKLYVNEDGSDAVPPDLAGVLDGMDLGDKFDFDLAKWYWNNYRDQFWLNLVARCFNA